MKNEENELSTTVSNQPSLQPPELIPCRFCGKESKGHWDGPYVHVSGPLGALQFYSIVCNGCCSTASYERREDAVAKWNTRARVRDGVVATVVDSEAPAYDGSMTPEQVERAALIAESRGIDLETAQELVYLRDRVAAIPQSFEEQ